MPWWNEAASAKVKLALAVVALAIVCLRLAREQRAASASGAAPRLRTFEAWAMRFAGVLGVLAYVNFGAFHFDGVYVHLWDAAHHYLGAKYFDELGYDGLYDCLVIADAEAGSAARGSERHLTDLRNNRIELASDLVHNPQRCRDRFAPARWTAFRQDVDFFRARFPPADWERLTLDHGFNASPAWVLLAHPLAGRAPVSWWRLELLAALDPALMLAALAAVRWAFGGWTAALVAVVWGTYFPARFWWTGGSLLRWDWLAALLAGLALCRKQRPAAGGALLGHAALSRVFPGFALVGIAFGLTATWMQRRVLDRVAARALAGALAAAIVLIPLSAGLHRPHGWSEFARDLAKHTGRPSGNRMGLAVALAFDPTGRRSVTPGTAIDARDGWEEAESDTMRRRRPLWIVLALAGASAVALACRGRPVWATGALGLFLIPLGAPIACYYYAFIAAWALLEEQRREVAGMTLALVVASQLIAGLKGYALAEQYAAQSIVVLLAGGFVLSGLVRVPGPRDPERVRGA